MYISNRMIVGKFPTHRTDRIRTIRLKLIVHKRLAKHNEIIKGDTHIDTIHEWDVVEELSVKLSKELRLLQADIEDYEEKKINSWDIDIMEREYDV